MNPGVSAATTGVLPSRRARRATASVTAGSVIGPAITSTSAISGTGLKKCIPTTRPGFAVAERCAPPTASSCSSPGWWSASAAASRRRNASRLSVELLRDRLDHQLRRRERLERGRRVAMPAERAAACPSSVSWPFSTLRARNPPMRSTRAIGGTVDRVVNEDLQPGLRGDLGDAGAHRARAQHPDGRGSRSSAAEHGLALLARTPPRPRRDLASGRQGPAAPPRRPGVGERGVLGGIERAAW